MHDKIHPLPSPEFSRRRRELAPDVDKAFHAFSDAAFAEGAVAHSNIAPEAMADAAQG